MEWWSSFYSVPGREPFTTSTEESLLSIPLPRPRSGRRGFGTTASRPGPRLRLQEFMDDVDINFVKNIQIIQIPSKIFFVTSIFCLNV